MPQDNRSKGRMRCLLRPGKAEQPLWGHTPSPDVSNEMNTVCCPPDPTATCHPWGLGQAPRCKRSTHLLLAHLCQGHGIHHCWGFAPFPLFSSLLFGCLQKEKKTREL